MDEALCTSDGMHCITHAYTPYPDMYDIICNSIQVWHDSHHTCIRSTYALTCTQCTLQHYGIGMTNTSLQAVQAVQRSWRARPPDDSCCGWLQCFVHLGRRRGGGTWLPKMMAPKRHASHWPQTRSSLHRAGLVPGQT